MRVDTIRKVSLQGMCSNLTMILRVMISIKLFHNVCAIIDSMIDSGLHIRVSQVGADPENVVVASDQGGGRLINKITIPISLGAPVDFGINLPPIADVQKRYDKINIKPEEVPKLPSLSNSKGEVKKGEGDEDEEVVAESVESNDTYTQRYL